MISDLVTVGEQQARAASAPQIWADWLAHAPDKAAYLRGIREAGFRAVEVVDEQAFTGPHVPEVLRGRILSIHVQACR